MLTTLSITRLERSFDGVPLVWSFTALQFVLREILSMHVLDRLGDEGGHRVVGFVGLGYIACQRLNALCAFQVAHLYMSFGRGGQLLVPAWRFGDGSGGRMLLAGQVPLFFDLEHFGVVIVDSASAAPLDLRNLANERGEEDTLCRAWKVWHAGEGKSV